MAVVASGGDGGGGRRTWMWVGGIISIVVLGVGIGFGVWQGGQNQSVRESQAASSGGYCTSDKIPDGPAASGLAQACTIGGDCVACIPNQNNGTCPGGENFQCCFGTGGTNPDGSCHCNTSCGGSGPVPTAPQTCTINARIQVFDGVWVDISGNNTYQLPYGTASVIFRGVNAATGQMSQNVTARMVWNNDGFKGISRANEQGSESLPGPNGYPTRFEAFENQVGRTSDPYDQQVQSYFDEGTCVNRGGVTISTVVPSPSPTLPPQITPSLTPTPTDVPPTATLVPTLVIGTYQCQEIQLIRDGVQIAMADVQVGDRITFRGFAGANNTSVSSLRFILTKGGVAQAPVEVGVSGVATGRFQADYEIVIDEATSYSMRVVPLSP